MFPILLAIQVLISISIIALVLLQQGKGADMGVGFGGGASGTVFGARGSGSFFTRATAILAAIFFINCLLIASPLVREGTKQVNTLAERIEQQSMQQQTAEQPAPADTAPVAAQDAGQPVKAGDSPAAPPATGAEKPVVNDLPQ